MSPVRRAARPAVVALLLTALLGACSHGQSAAPPRTTTTEPPTTDAPATTRPTVVTIPGRPRTTVTDPTDIQGGAATIMGSVTGPQGAVTGATVRVQRTVGTQTTTMDLTSSGGLFNLQAVRGGAYEVQAWKQPDLLLTTPQTFFLGATEVKTLSLPLTLISAVNARTTVTPSPPPAQSPFTITVLLYAGSVGGQGTLLATPRANQPVTFQPGNGLSLQSSGQASTDSGGNASFSVQCVVPGPPSANLMVSTLKIALVDLPPCPSS